MRKEIGEIQMIGLSRAQPGNKGWHLERAEHTEGYTVLWHFGWWRSCPSFCFCFVDGGMIKGDQTHLT